MESLTKNKQIETTIRKMAEKFFAPHKMTGYRELTEGYFNVAYLVELDDGRQVILKVAPPVDARIMTYEKNIMLSEVEAMKMAAGKGDIPVPEVYGYDESCTICPSPYFFMEKLSGSSLSSIKDTLTAAQLERIYRETGEINRRINAITCPCFGYPGQKEFQGEAWFSVFRKMLQAGLDDADRGKVATGIPGEKLMKHLEMDRECFEEVKVPYLIHWDLWDGNVFIENGEITGLIDWERSIWGDPLLEVGFRTYSDNLDFRRGYGKEELTAMEERRALWYDIYLLLLMSLECEYRRYDTMDMYKWACGLLGQQFDRVIALHK